MINGIYLSKIKEIFKKRFAHGEKVFIFGSSADSKNFADIDLAIVSEKPMDERILRLIREDLEESSLPYKFDVVDINKTNNPFRARVLNGPKIWII